MIASRDMGYAFAAFRLLLTQRVASFHVSSSGTSHSAPSLAAGQEPVHTTPAAAAVAAGEAGQGIGAAAAQGQSAAGSTCDLSQLVLGDPVLASFASLLEDELLLSMMQKQWKTRCKDMGRTPVGSNSRAAVWEQLRKRSQKIIGTD
jgi:hypothetical protein